jgi:hypothetical protein
MKIYKDISIHYNEEELSNLDTLDTRVDIRIGDMGKMQDSLYVGFDTKTRGGNIILYLDIPREVWEDMKKEV